MLNLSPNFRAFKELKNDRKGYGLIGFFFLILIQKLSAKTYTILHADIILLSLKKKMLL